MVASPIPEIDSFPTEQDRVPSAGTSSFLLTGRGHIPRQRLLWRGEQSGWVKDTTPFVYIFLAEYFTGHKLVERWSMLDRIATRRLWNLRIGIKLLQWFHIMLHRQIPQYITSLYQHVGEQEFRLCYSGFGGNEAVWSKAEGTNIYSIFMCLCILWPSWSSSDPLGHERPTWAERPTWVISAV